MCTIVGLLVGMVGPPYLTQVSHARTHARTHARKHARTPCKRDETHTRHARAPPAVASSSIVGVGGGLVPLYIFALYEASLRAQAWGKRSREHHLQPFKGSYPLRT